MSAWGGISSLQLGLSVLWTLAEARGHTIGDVIRWSSTEPARLAGLAERKGSVEVGYDADFVIWDDRASFCVDGKLLRHRHKITPYDGRMLKGVVHKTLLRGTEIYDRDRGVGSSAHGAFLEIKKNKG